MRPRSQDRMSTFRLLKLQDLSVDTFQLDRHPPYLAASHAWVESAFGSTAADFAGSFGHKAIVEVVKQLYPHVKYCWLDRLCIIQGDKRDKLEQIPLMQNIFKQAEAVPVLVNDVLGTDQGQVDGLVTSIRGAIEMHDEESWGEHGAQWLSSPGRQLLIRAMEGLSKLSSTVWASRIWTLQEYILAQRVVWIGRDLVPITFDDRIASALPIICDTLNIEECLGQDMRPTFSFLQGMANARTAAIDRTRVMELLGNRFTKHAVDQVYGAMAASGVILNPIADESNVTAWQRWCETAIRQGNARWALLPANPQHTIAGPGYTCALPTFQHRHVLSSSSGLDYVTALKPMSCSDGCVSMSCRRFGTVKILRRLGTVHEARNGLLQRDITLVLFAGGKKRTALQLAMAFGGGRYSEQGLESIARVLVRAFYVASAHVLSSTEAHFRPPLLDEHEDYFWSDFMQLQQSQMIGLNEGFGHLVRIEHKHTQQSVLTVLVAAEQLPHGEIEALDFEAQCPDERCVVMAVVRNPGRQNNVHKVGMSLPISAEYCASVRDISVTEVDIGGYDCHHCSQASLGSVAPRHPDDEAAALHESRRVKVARALEAHLRKRNAPKIGQIVDRSTRYQASSHRGRGSSSRSTRRPVLMKWRAVRRHAI